MGSEDAVNCILEFLKRELNRASKAATDGDFVNQARLHEIENVFNVCANIKDKKMDELPVFEFELMNPNAKLPAKSHPTDSGWDVFAAESVTLVPGVPKVVKTGLRCKLAPGYELQVRSRSGMAAKFGVVVANSPGTVDTLFRGEVGVILTLSPNVAMLYSTDGGTIQSPQSYMVNVGDKIAQLVPAKVEQVRFVQVQSIDVNTDRGAGGFGSTGK